MGVKWIDLPPVWMVGFIGLAWVQATYFPWDVFGPWADPMGVMIALSGIALWVLAIMEMRRFRTTVNPHGQPDALVTTGIFSMTRNPIYLGDILMLLGAILWLDAVPSVLLLPIFGYVLVWRFIKPEENRLQAAFPEEFDAYALKVGRWF